MKNILIISFLFFNQFFFGQTVGEYGAIDMKMAQIPDELTTTTSGIAGYINSNFKTENEKSRAVFYWIANNISYDVPNMYEPNYLDSASEKIAKTLKLKKGVCIHYAEVYNDIANQLGISTYIIPGYTKQGGKVATISHVWCASKIDGKWFLFDPTWGSGYIDGQKFIKRLNNNYFKVEPKKMIVSHMPFDYLWQFLSSPYTNQEFYNGKEELNKSKANFHYLAEIGKYEKLSEGDQAFESAKRVERNGFKNNLITEHHTLLKNQFTVLNQNQNINKLNSVVTDYNEAVSYLNDYVVYRFQKFKPSVSDDELKKRMQNIKDRFTKCNNDIYKVGSVGSQNTAMLSNLKKNISLNILEVEKQETFLKEYLSKGTVGRKMMMVNHKVQN